MNYGHDPSQLSRTHGCLIWFAMGFVPFCIFAAGFLLGRIL